MSDELANVTEALIEEIGRYLAAIDLFRAEGCEPTWQSECTLWCRSRSC